MSTEFTLYAGWGKSRLTVVSRKPEFILVRVLFVNYCIIFHVSNCKPTFAQTCIWVGLYSGSQNLPHPTKVIGHEHLCY